MEENKKMDEPVISLNNNVSEEPVSNAIPESEGLVIPSMEVPSAPENVNPNIEIDEMEDVIIDNTIESPKEESVLETPVVEEFKNAIPETPASELEDNNPVVEEVSVQEASVDEASPVTEEVSVSENIVEESSPVVEEISTPETPVEEILPVTEEQPKSEEVKEEVATPEVLEEKSEVVESNSSETISSPQEENLQETSLNETPSETSTETTAEAKPEVEAPETTPSETPEDITPGPTPNEPPKDLLGAPEPQVIGKLKRPGEKGIIIVAVLFAILALVAWQLPNIKKYMETGELPWDKKPVVVTPNPGIITDIPDVDEEGYYHVSGAGKYEDENIKLSDFAVLNDELTLNILLVDAAFNMETSDYELEIFDKDKVSLEIIPLITTKTLSIEEKTQIKFSVQDSSKVIYVKINKSEEVPAVNPDDLPEIEIVNNTLKCSKENISLGYVFKEKALTSIYVTLKFPKVDEATFETDYAKYETIKNNQVAGVSKSINKQETEFVYSEAYDLANYTPTGEEAEYVFQKDALAKLVNHYNTENGYVCN